MKQKFKLMNDKDGVVELVELKFNPEQLKDKTSIKEADINQAEEKEQSPPK